MQIPGAPVAAGRTQTDLIVDMALAAERPDFGPEAAAAILDGFLGDASAALDDRCLQRRPDEPWALHPRSTTTGRGR